jgi:hypothetical protein
MHAKADANPIRLVVLSHYNATDTLAQFRWRRSSQDAISIVLHLSRHDHTADAASERERTTCADVTSLIPPKREPGTTGSCGYDGCQFQEPNDASALHPRMPGCYVTLDTAIAPLRCLSVPLSHAEKHWKASSFVFPHGKGSVGTLSSSSRPLSSLYANI